MTHFKDVGPQLSKIVKSNLDVAAKNWLDHKIETIIERQSTKDLYLTYSLVSSKVKTREELNLSNVNSKLKDYVEIQRANIQELSRIYLLIKVLEADEEFFGSKVANIIQVADKGELETFLKFLILLPNAEKYKTTGVEALRTNISTVFNAIAYNNPYPGKYFDKKQWNQMYLKTAFMQGDLSAIQDIDGKANEELANIISDYAHERWAASREVDPYFWRPATKFLNKNLLHDMQRLLESADTIENKAAALCLFNSGSKEALNLLAPHLELLKKVKNGTITWDNLKD